MGVMASRDQPQAGRRACGRSIVRQLADNLTDKEHSDVLGKGA